MAISCFAEGKQHGQLIYFHYQYSGAEQCSGDYEAVLDGDSVDLTVNEECADSSSAGWQTVPVSFMQHIQQKVDSCGMAGYDKRYDAGAGDDRKWSLTLRYSDDTVVKSGGDVKYPDGAKPVFDAIVNMFAGEVKEE